MVEAITKFLIAVVLLACAGCGTYGGTPQAATPPADTAEGMSDDTVLEVKVGNAGMSTPPYDALAGRICLTLAAEITLRKQERVIWADFYLIGPTLASADERGFKHYCNSPKVWSERGNMYAYLDEAVLEVSVAVRERLTGLPWKPLVVLGERGEFH